MNNNYDLILQYVCNLIMEYWESKEIVPKEPKKLLLGFYMHIKGSSNDYIRVITAIKLFFQYEFANQMHFLQFLIDDVFNSVYFKLMCDELRGKK